MTDETPCYVDNSSCVVCPEITAVPGQPARVDLVQVQGWNAGANSVERLNAPNLRVQYGVTQSVGVICGLARAPRPMTAHPGEIAAAWYTFTSPTGALLLAQPIAYGVLQHTPVQRAADSDLEVRRVDGRVEYILDGEVMFTGPDLPGRLLVGAALYASGDAIDPILFEAVPDSAARTYTGAIEAHIRPPRVRANGIGENVLQAHIRPPRVEISGHQRTAGAVVSHIRPPRVRVNAFGPNVIEAHIRPPSVFISTTASPPIPTVNLIEVRISPPRVVVAGLQRTSAAIEVHIRPPRVSILEPGPNVLQSRIRPPRVAIREAASPSAMFVLEYHEPWLSMWVGAFYLDVRESLALDDRLSIARLVAHVRERFGLADDTGSLLQAVLALTETVALGEVLRIVWRVVVSESLAFGAESWPYLTLVQRITDTLVLHGIAADTLEARVAVAEAFALADSPQPWWMKAVAEAFALHATVEQRLAAILAVLERLDLGDTVTPRLTLLGVVSDTLSLRASTETQLTAIQFVRESLALLGRIVIGGEVYSCWVINTESKGVGRYDNYPFNSFPRLGDHLLGLTSTGLYQLDGEDDDGVAIQSRLRSGLMDFGSRQAKRMPDVFLGYRADESLVIKIITADPQSGEKAEYWYEVQAHPVPSQGQSRFRPGRGLKSVYWGFELATITGGDVEIDVVRWEPIFLDRKLT